MRERASTRRRSRRRRLTDAAPAPFRILPRVNDENRFFWTSGEDGQLRFLRCDDCGLYVHPPSPICPDCLSK